MLPAVKGGKLFFFLIFISIVFASCSHRYRIVSVPRDVDMPPAAHEAKIPLHVGLYVNDILRACRDCTYGGRCVSIGEAILANSEKMAKDIFAEVTLVKSSKEQPESLTEKYDVFMAPELIKSGYFSVVSGVGATLDMKWNIISPDGREIYTTTIKGYEIIKKFLYYEEDYVRIYRLALRNHFQKAREDIYNGGWWKTQWWKEGNKEEKEKKQ